MNRDEERVERSSPAGTEAAESTTLRALADERAALRRLAELVARGADPKEVIVDAAGVLAVRSPTGERTTVRAALPVG